jgi:hypothetical protein
MKLRILFLLIVLAIFSSACKDKNADKPVSVNLEEEKPTVDESQPQTEAQDEATAKPTKKTKVTNVKKDLTIGMHKVVAKNGLMLRTEPKRDSPAVVRMDKNAQAKILEYTNIEDEFEGNRARWAKVKYKKYTGYAFTSYLEPLAGAKKIDPSKVAPEEE